MGSIHDNQSGGHYGYRMSKASVNMLVKNIAIETKADGLIVCALHPGWVKTDMGGPSAPLEIQESIAGMTQVIDRLTPSDSGAFLDYRGRSLPY